MTHPNVLAESWEPQYPSEDIVSLVRHNGDLSTKSRLETLERAVDLIGGLDSLRSPLIVKTNVHTHPSQVALMLGLTSPKMVEALIKLALKQQKHLSVKIVESDSSNKLLDEFVWTRFGYTEVVDRLTDAGYDVSLVNISHPPLVKLRLNGLHFKEVQVNELLTKEAYFVSLMVPKTHPISFVTGVTKNMFGLLPDKDKIAYHSDINNVILDCARIMKPNLCVLDAIVGLECTYPIATHGRPRRINALIAGRNPVSVDATMARLMGFQPENIRHLVEGAKLGLGSLNPKIVGERLEEMTVNFKPPAHVWPIATVEHS